MGTTTSPTPSVARPMSLEVFLVSVAGGFLVGVAGGVWYGLRLVPSAMDELNRRLGRIRAARDGR